MATCRQCNGIGYIGPISSGEEGGHTCGACGGRGTITNHSFNRFTPREKKITKPLPKAVVVASSIISGLWALLFIFTHSSSGNPINISAMIGIAITTGFVWVIALLVFNVTHILLPKSKSNSRGSLFIEVILLIIIPIIAFNIIF